jgi:two-component system phosphate regulon sensor histidine kinase PhoR
MGRRKLIWQLYSAFLLTIAIPALLFTWYSTATFRNFFLKTTVNELTERSHQIGVQMEGLIGLTQPAIIDSICKTIGQNIVMRFTVIATDGTVLGDSEKDPNDMENHKNRSEVLSALNGTVGVSQRFSNTLNEQMMYIATPVFRGQELLGVVRSAISISVINHELTLMYLRFGLGYLVLAIIAALASFFISRQISLPIEAMKQGALDIASGDFAVKINPSGTYEIDQLVNVLNEMGGKLRNTINTLTEQRNRIDAVLSSMVEGVIALDNNEKIIAINDAAVCLFSLEEKPSTGTWIGEVLRNAAVSSFMKKVQQSGNALEDEFTLIVNLTIGESSTRILQLHGNVLRNAEGNSIGVLTVINDTTRLKRLETMRSDFIANVSHELRTPLTSVKGFVETLLSGAIDSREESIRFLDIISRQVERLSNITEDLLTLSRIEEEAKSHGPELHKVKIFKLLTAVQETCGTRASAKHITLELRCDQTTEVEVEGALIEEALINLVDNAVNYSHEGGHVIISGSVDVPSHEICFSVTDNGCGIAAEHHERIFERFYRVDKARSRKLGGSGLGLSIVKHIALVHNGRATVKSSPGKGSTFYIHIPLLNSDTGGTKV